MRGFLDGNTNGIKGAGKIGMLPDTEPATL
jgi:hypothetical protein